MVGEGGGGSESRLTGGGDTGSCRIDSKACAIRRTSRWTRESPRAGVFHQPFGTVRVVYLPVLITCFCYGASAIVTIATVAIAESIKPWLCPHQTKSTQYVERSV